MFLRHKSSCLIFSNSFSSSTLSLFSSFSGLLFLVTKSDGAGRALFFTGAFFFLLLDFLGISAASWFNKLTLLVGGSISGVISNASSGESENTGSGRFWLLFLDPLLSLNIIFLRLLSGFLRLV